MAARASLLVLLALGWVCLTVAQVKVTAPVTSVTVDPKTGKVDVDAAGVKVAVKPDANTTVVVKNTTVVVKKPAAQPAPKNTTATSTKVATGAASKNVTKTVPKAKVVVSPIANVSSTNDTVQVKAPFTNVTVKPGSEVNVSAPFTKVVSGVNSTTITVPVVGTIVVPAGRRLSQTTVVAPYTRVAASSNGAAVNTPWAQVLATRQGTIVSTPWTGPIIVNGRRMLRGKGRHS